MVWEIAKLLSVFVVLVIGMVVSIPIIGLLEYCGIIKPIDVEDFEDEVDDN